MPAAMRAHSPHVPPAASRPESPPLGAGLLGRLAPLAGRAEPSSRALPPPLLPRGSSPGCLARGGGGGREAASRGLVFRGGPVVLTFPSCARGLDCGDLSWAPRGDVGASLCAACALRRGLRADGSTCLSSSPRVKGSDPHRAALLKPPRHGQNTWQLVEGERLGGEGCSTPMPDRWCLWLTWFFGWLRELRTVSARQLRQVGWSFEHRIPARRG
jgi:hypothetical protein